MNYQRTLSVPTASNADVWVSKQETRMMKTRRIMKRVKKDEKRSWHVADIDC